MFATMPNNGYGHQHVFNQWTQSQQIPQQQYTFTTEPDVDPSLLASVSVPFMPPHIVPSQQYPRPQPDLSAHPAYAQQLPNYSAFGPGVTTPPHSSDVSDSPSPIVPPPPPPQRLASKKSGPPSAKRLAPLLPSPPASHNGDKVRSAKGTKRSKNDAAEDDTESGDSSSDDGAGGGGGPTQASATGTGAPARRPPGACTYCRRVKMKCEFPPGSETCKRCRSGNHECVVEGRKPRRAPSKREYLLAQLRQKDGIIESLLKQLHNPYSNQPVSVATYQSSTPEADHHRQSVVAWLDQLQTSVRNPVKRLDTNSNASHDRARASSRDESDDESARGGLALVSDEDTHPTLPDTASPLGFLANLALGNLRQEDGHRVKRIRADGSSEPEQVGIANDEYFVPGPSLDLSRRISMSDKHTAPDLIVHGVIHPSEIQGLFNHFHTRVNVFAGILDPNIHTPQETFSRSPLLFSTVCAIALRVSDRPTKPDAAPLAMHFAKKAAADALVDGWKSAELAQAYFFLSKYATPTRKLEEDRSMLYAGLAVRIASDLNVRAAALKTPRDEAEAREIGNLRRLWMATFTLDKETAATFGQPSTVREESISGVPEGFPALTSESNPFDIHLAAKSMLMRDLTRFHAEIFSDPSAPGALNLGLDLREIVLRYDAEFTRTADEWMARFNHESDGNNPAAAFRCKLLPFYVGASRLVILSFMLQQAFRRGLQQNDDVFFKRSMEVARQVVKIMLDLIAPTGYLRYSPDCYFVYSTFASAFLLKLLRPECRPFIRESREREVCASIERLIDTFNSPKVAIDDRHTPHLYAEFLSKLLAKHIKDAGRSRSGSPQSHPSPSSSIRSYPSPRPQPQIFATPADMTYAPAMHPISSDMSATASAFPTWDTNYPSPESLPELNEPVQMGAGAPFEFTFTAPPPEEERCAEEELSSQWWKDLATTGFEWISGGVTMDNVNVNAMSFPSPYEQSSAQDCFVPQPAF